MLRIQSRLNHVILNRRELTPIIIRIAAINNEVYSLVQNVTVEVYSKDPNLFRSRKLRRPRFSFFSSSIVKEQTSHPSRNLFPQSQAPKPRTINQHRSQFRKH
jgi:hypothetical protein